MNEYISFFVLSDGLVMCVFSEWNFCSMCGFVDNEVGWLISLFSSVIVH
jgi:hypothetical protein